MAKKKHQPPAKIRYDKTHPTVSARVDLKLKQQLEELKEISGKSVGDVLREAMKVQKRSSKRAYSLGMEAGKKLYAVQYKCSVCGGTIWLNTAKEKKAAAECMRNEGWGHGNCIG